MLQILPQIKTLIPENSTVENTIELINSYIDNNQCESLKIDLSHLNILDACRVSTLCSTNHFIKYPNGKISWIVSSSLIQEFNKSLDLGNTEFIL